MTKALLKKQLMELFSFFWRDRKKNKVRTGGRLVLSVALYLILFLVVSVIFYVLASALCMPLAAAGMDWLYFALMGLIGIAMGAFGSVFNTYASLYQAKDNYMLMAMPVKPLQLLFVRLMGVYLMGLLYELLVMVPTLLVYYTTAAPGAGAVIGSILVTLLNSVFVLIISTILGWVVALLSGKTRRKSLMAVALSLAFIAAYYYIYATAYQMLSSIIAAPGIAGSFIRRNLYPLYQMGLAAEGRISALLIFSAMVLGLFAVVYLILAKSYIKIVTTSKGEVRKKYKEQAGKAGSLKNALFSKELRRFLNSPTYMLNCGLGIVLMVIAAVVLVIKGGSLMIMLNEIFGSGQGVIPLLACAMICMAASMNDITAPSVSLEGKTIWLLQSYPVSAWQALAAKLRLHLTLTIVPVLLLTAAIEYVLRPDVIYMVLIPVVAVLFVLFMAAFGLTMNLLMPNLTWTDETVPVKQSMGVMLSLFGGWVLVLALGGIYYLVGSWIAPGLYLFCVALLLLAGSVCLLLWLKNKGAKIFQSL